MLLAPLAGWILAGREPVDLAGFPPPLPPWLGGLAHYWALSVLVVLVAIWLVEGWAQAAVKRRQEAGYVRPLRLVGKPAGRFPAYGWLALLVLVLSWWLAWTRYPWMAPYQLYTYTPLWTGFIFLLNALAQWLHGRSPLSLHRGRFLLLFPTSSLFWWFFEYLNRFTANWLYQPLAAFGEVEYYLHGSLAFSTVLPALLSMRALIGGSAGGLDAQWADGPRGHLPSGRASGWTLAGVGLGGFVLLGLFPHYCFPWLWIGPLLVLWGLFRAFGADDPLAPVERRDWRFPFSWAFAGLACGFFWELWNSLSLAKWQYAVPLFQGWKLFEMPLAGYIGYLPFGIVCGFVVNRIFGAWEPQAATDGPVRPFRPKPPREPLLRKPGLATTPDRSAKAQ